MTLLGTGAAAGRPTTVMCSESLYWRCHRRLIADAVVVSRATAVVHLFHDGGTRPYRLTEGLRADESGPVYDVPASGPGGG